jgi:RNA polymerase sigma-70 factor (ECF subfamily)
LIASALSRNAKPLAGRLSNLEAHQKGSFPNMHTIDVEISHGKIRGARHEGVTIFKGIPYAGRVSGDRRFRRPAELQPWPSVPLHQFIRRRVSDPHGAEDILQDVFLKIHTRIDTLHRHDRIAAWIYQIARNAIADYYRAQRPTTDLPAILALSDDLSEDDVVRELLPCVAAMVDALPDTYREALRLTEYEGLSQKQLSEQLGISFSGAKSRVQRARAKIKEQLLDCCHFQLDHAGQIINYQPHYTCCAGGNCDMACSN